MADSTRRVSVRLSLDDAARVKQELREVGETGQRSLERIQGGADRASRALDLLDVAVRGVQIAGLAAGLRAVVVAGDALTQSMGRLNTALGSVERAGEIYDRLYRDSLQTGVAVRESVDAFARFSIAAREIGATSDQVATLVGGLQRIAIASGASQQEIASSTQQLAQALASGTLQGDELRSILEGLPTLAQALARELGVSIGELRKLGSEGKLTADTVFPALLRAVERLNGEFERAPFSVGRAFGQLTAATDQFLARLDQAIGLSNALARALSGAARVLDGVRRGSGLLLPSEQEADRRAQAEALRAQIARLEAESDGRDSLRSQPRRGSIRGGLVGVAEQQAGVDPPPGWRNSAASTRNSRRRSPAASRPPASASAPSRRPPPARPPRHAGAALPPMPRNSARRWTIASGSTANTRTASVACVRRRPPAALPRPTAPASKRSPCGNATRRCAASRAPPAASPPSRGPTARPSARSTTSSASASG